MNVYITTPIPIAYNNSPTTGPDCFLGGDTLSCPADALLLDNDTGSAELDISTVFAWDREVSIVFILTEATKVRQVNLFFYNIPSSGIGLPPAELFWSDTNVFNPDGPLSHVIVGNQDLSQDDRTLRNVSLVVTTVTADYRYFRFHIPSRDQPDRLDPPERSPILWRSRWPSVYLLAIEAASPTVHSKYLMNLASHFGNKLNFPILAWLLSFLVHGF